MIDVLIARVEDHVYVLLVHDSDAARWDAIETLDRWGCDPELNLNAGEIHRMASAILPVDDDGRFQLPEASP